MWSDRKIIALRKNKKKWSIIKRITYSRIIFVFLLILIQIAVFAIFIFWLEPYMKYFLGGSLAMSVAFMIFLVNSSGKNEFKLAWLFPVLVSPIFGVSFYIYYHVNYGGITVGKRLGKIKDDSNKFLPSPSETQKITEAYPQVADLTFYMRKCGNYPSYQDSSVEFFPNGERFFSDFLEELKKAEKFIFIESFAIALDESWIQILEILHKKVQDGVEVRLLYDGLGSIYTATKRYEKHLNEMGIRAKIFLPLIPIFATHQNNRDHRKIAIIDGKIAYTGGLNIANQYFNIGTNKFAYWKDNAVKIKGPAIRSFITMFLQTWNLNLQTDTNYGEFIDLDYEVQKTRGVTIPYGDDNFNNEDIAENVYDYILSHAKKYVHITSPYIVIDNQMLSSLIFAAQRGIDVSIIVPAKWDHFITYCLGRVYIKKLIDKGVHVWEYQKGFIHAKTFVSDDTSATVGSVNLDYRSFYHHFECGLFMYDLPCIAEIERDFQETKKDCTEVTVQSYKKTRWLIRAIGWVGNLFAPLA